MEVTNNYNNIRIKDSPMNPLSNLMVAKENNKVDTTNDLKLFNFIYYRNVLPSGSVNIATNPTFGDEYLNNIAGLYREGNPYFVGLDSNLFKRDGDIISVSFTLYGTPTNLKTGLFPEQVPKYWFVSRTNTGLIAPLNNMNYNPISQIIEEEYYETLYDTKFNFEIISQDIKFLVRRIGSKFFVDTSLTYAVIPSF